MANTLPDNIRYRAPEIERFYRDHRVRWADFYESERVVLERLGLGPATRVLDIGCGCGGLGLALHERFGTTRYTGIEINARAAATASKLNPRARIIEGDILEIPDTALGGDRFDVVISLGCIDWNTRFSDMLGRAYALVAAGGYFVSSFRLTPGNGVNDIEKSHQFINFHGRKEGEKACYVVVNARDLLRQLLALNPDQVIAYGYWGAPSATAVTPFEKLCFGVFAVRRPVTVNQSPELMLDLPPEIAACMTGRP